MFEKKDVQQAHNLIITLLFVLVLIQAVNLYFTINPVARPVYKGLSKQEKQIEKQNREILKKVAKLTKIDEQEQALIITIKDADSLRSANKLSAEIYKDAKNGDKVILFPKKIIIYRENENRIIYEGKSPLQIQKEAYDKLLQKTVNAVNNLTRINLQEKPKLLTVTDPEALRKKDSKIYKDVRKGDLILVYTDRTIIYRPSENKLIYDSKK